jgi:hypothetical protein
MIYITKKSKKFPRSKILKKSITDAKIFLYELNRGHFELSEYFVMGSDFIWEMEDLLKFFSEDYILRHEKDTFDIYYVNPKLDKTKRQRDNHIRLSSFTNLGEKLQNSFKDYNVSFSIKNERIAINLYNDLHGMIFIIDDNLNILDAYIETQQAENILSTFEEVKKRLNTLLIKRRSYYKTKGKKHDNE